MERKDIDYSMCASIGVVDIQIFVEYYRKCLLDLMAPEVLEFEFSPLLNTVDELFYSYLLLFHGDFPETRIILHFHGESKAYRIAIYQVGFIKIYGDFVDIYKDGQKENDGFSIESEKFIPLLFVTSETYKMFFTRLKIDFSLQEYIKERTPREKQELDKSFSIKETFFKKIRSYKPKRNLLDLAWHYLVAILDDLNVLREFYKGCFPERKNYSYKLNSYWRVQTSAEFAQEILKTLSNEGFFRFKGMEVFLFRLLIKNQVISQVSDKVSDINEFQQQYLYQLKKLIKYVRQLSAGLEELAKNLVEHSGKRGKEGFGVISARIFDKERVELLKNTSANFEKWYRLYEVGKYVFLDINVIDSGDKIITKKYIENLKADVTKWENIDSSSREQLKFDFEKDIETMSDTIHPYTFSRLLDYEHISLFHQTKRSNSRLGLLFFSNLIINERKGFVRVSSSDLFIPEQQDTAFLYVAENGRLNKIQDLAGQDGRKSCLLGTNYSFIIPVIREENSDIVFSNADKSVGTSSSIFKHLFKYFPETADKKGYIEMIDDVVLPDSDDKYEKIFLYQKNIEDRLQGNYNKIVLINADQVKNILVNSSDWMRFIATLQLGSNCIKLIIYNIEEVIHDEIIELNKIFNKTNLSFWNNEYALLFYVKVNYEFPVGNRRLSLWFNDVLSGKTYEDYRCLNREISRYHHNLYLLKEEVNSSENLYNGKIDSPFFAENKLLNFELLIKNKQGLSLYEESVQSLLNLEILSVENVTFWKSISVRDNFFNIFKGYKISNSHFKLGNKLHISDYYYAKRLFYNSFYSNRFAFLVANYLLYNNLRNKLKDVDVTLIGYSHYSELLVSNVRRLLNSLGYNNINHDIILENDKILKNIEKIKKSIILIIPISTTFSTSLKIKRVLNKFLKNKYEKIEFLQPDISLLVVGNTGFTDVNTPLFTKSTKDLYETFGWQVDCMNKNYSIEKIIKVAHDDDIVMQKYFIGLESEWQTIYNCKFCYPKEKNENEVCLLETEKNNVTPDIIFELPVSCPNQNKRDFSRLFQIGSQSLITHRYITKLNIDYVFYIKIGSFFNTKDSEKEWLKAIIPVSIEKKETGNRALIRKWLDKRFRNNSFFVNNYLNEKKVVIVTPSRSSDSGFVNFVNEVLFSDTATVLQFNLFEDCLQNFVKFHSNLFQNSKVIFVDDVISSASSYNCIKDYIRYASSREKTIDFCITLFNRLSFYQEKKILNDFSSSEYGIESFVRVNIPPLINDYNKFPYSMKIETYGELGQKSLLDMMRMHFKERQAQAEPVDLDNDKRLLETTIESLFHFIVFHEVFAFFSGDCKKMKLDEIVYDHIKDVTEFGEERELSFLNIVKFVEKSISLQNFLRLHEIYKSEIENCILRILSEPPFIQYKILKEIAFEGVSSRLKKLVKSINNVGIKSDFFECKKGQELTRYSRYHYFKFLLRLAVNLKINYIFSAEVFAAISKLLNEFRCPVQIKYYIKENKNVYDYEIKEGKNKRIFAIGFITYYVGLIQEMIIRDEAKAIQLVRNVVKYIRLNKIPDEKLESIEIGLNDEQKRILTLRNTFKNHFVFLLRLLVLENNFIFETFHEHFYAEQYDDLKEYTLLKQAEKLDGINEFVNNKLEPYKCKYRFEALELMLSKYRYKDEGETVRLDSALQNAFYKTMYLKTLLKNEISDNTQRKNLCDAGGETSISKISLKQKINFILKYLCEILGISTERNDGEGGAFFTVRYKNQQVSSQAITPDDLYIIDNYMTSKKHKLKTLYSTENSLLLKVFRGIHRTESKKPKSTLELLYRGNEWFYDDVSLGEKKIEEFVETYPDQQYHNIFFLRISDVISGGLQGIFEADPVAVLCFYKNQVLPGRKYLTLRFDPKRIRFLLLLRDDIRKFIEIHLSNDSLRAFVEEENKANYLWTLPHGIRTYKNTINHYKDNLNLVGYDFKLKKQYLDKSIDLLTNKINLMSVLSKNYALESPPLETYTLMEVGNKFREAIPFILTLYRDTLNELTDENYFKIDDKITKSQYEKEEVDFPESFLNEMIFELIYNIRRKALHPNYEDINPADPLIIRIDFLVENDKLFLVIANNFNLATAHEAMRLNDTIANKKNKHGLNLINEILMYKNMGNIETSVKCVDRVEWFNVKIPLKTYKDENNNSY